MTDLSALARMRARVTQAVKGDGGGLAARVIRGGSWTLAGNFGGQILRFLSNIWLTHLLFPAAFGVMAIAQSIIAGAKMLSDVGLQQSVIRSHRGHDEEFLNTVWTLQVLKGLGILVVMTAIAPLASRLYGQPDLARVIPGLGLAVLISGFASPKVALLNRNIEIGRIVSMELGTQLVGILVMGLWAWLSPTLWSLVAGNIVTALAMTLATHVFIPGPASRFAWQKSTVQEVWSFGGWVMLSSGMTYLVGEGRNLLNGSLVGPHVIGLMVISTMLVMVLWNAIQSISGRVLFPAYATVWRERPQNLPAVVERSRRIQLLAGCAIAILFALLGDRIVNLFYDARYREAGAFIQIQAAGSIVGFLGGTYGGVLWAIGRPGVSTVLLASQLLATVALLVVGHAVGGVLGLVVGMSLIGVAMYPVNALVYARFGLFQPRTDALPFLIAIALGAYVFLFGAWRGMSF
ncbi:MAG TPA: oligosaccharide flippase family protein [Burkholderiaceae bacterium]